MKRLLQFAKFSPALLLAVSVLQAPRPNGRWLLAHLMPWHHTWTNVQFPTPVDGSSGASVTQTIVAPTAANLGIIVTAQRAGTQTATISAPSCAATWTADVLQTGSGPVYIYRCSNLTGGGTSATSTWNGTNTCAANFCEIAFMEFASSTGSIALDTGATPKCSSTGSTSSPQAECSPLSLSGNNDVFIIGIISGTAPSACSLSYTCKFIASHFGAGYLLNQTSYSAPSWTISAGFNYAQGAAAYQEAAGGGATAVPFNKRRRLEQVDE